MAQLVPLTFHVYQLVSRKADRSWVLAAQSIVLHSVQSHLFPINIFECHNWGKS